MRRLLLAGLAAALLGAVVPATLADPAPDPAPAPEAPASAPRAAAPLDEETECLEPAPAAVGITGVTDRGQTVNLDVLVLVDGVAPARARAVMATAARSYAPIGIRLRPHFRAVRFPSAGRLDSDFDGKVNETANADRYFALAKRAVGGKPPRGIDLVYVLTAKDLYLPSEPADPADGRSYGVAGIADCIGGVRFDHRSFALGELFAAENLPIGPALVYRNASAKIAAHELGHLLGAHHHYANCAEHPVEPSRPTAVEPCTLMSNFIDFVGDDFGTLNAAMVRGHTTRWAAP